MVLVLTAVPAGLRGDLTKWLLEISPGVFVGNVSARVRDHLWQRVRGETRDGRALLVHNSDTEQGLTFESHGHDWEPVDFDGVRLMRRPVQATAPVRRTGWSAARNMQRARNPSWARRAGANPKPDENGGETRENP